MFNNTLLINTPLSYQVEQYNLDKILFILSCAISIIFNDQIFFVSCAALQPLMVKVFLDMLILHLCQEHRCNIQYHTSCKRINMFNSTPLLKMT